MSTESRRYCLSYVVKTAGWSTGLGRRNLMIRVIHITVICSPLDDARGSGGTIRSKKDTVRLVSDTLRDKIPNGYRCSLVVGIKNDE